MCISCDSAEVSVNCSNAEGIGGKLERRVIVLSRPGKLPQRSHTSSEYLTKATRHYFRILLEASGCHAPHRDTYTDEAEVMVS